jgi:hypothetical protein
MKLLFAVTLLAILSLAASLDCYQGKVYYEDGKSDIIASRCPDADKYCHHYQFDYGEKMGCGQCDKKQGYDCSQCDYHKCNYDGRNGAVNLSNTVPFVIAAAYLLVKLA